MSQFAYREYSHSIRDKIACAQFVSALSDVKRTLQLEGITSLRVAVERAKAVKLIQENCFKKKNENSFNFNKRRENFNNFERETENGLRFKRKESIRKFWEKECNKIKEEEELKNLIKINFKKIVKMINLATGIEGNVGSAGRRIIFVPSVLAERKAGDNRA